MTALNTLEKDDLLRRIAWLNAEVDKIKRMLKGEQMGTARIADAAITDAKIANLTWDKGQGGTLTLGGAANVDGVLSVLDNTGVEKGKWDKDGILIKSGKLEIRNDGEVVSMDAKGIVSTSNFTKTALASVGINQVITTNNVDTDITGITLTFTLNRTSIVLITFSCSAYLTESIGVNTGHGKELLWVDSFYAHNIIHNSGTVQLETRSVQYVATLTAGSHTIKGVANLTKTLGNPTLTIYDSQLSYTIFGT